jgi:probable HAF family extracellular repeat protein
MNTLWLRRLIRKHDTLGHLVAGLFLLAHYLLVRKRNLTLATLAAVCAASAAGLSLLHRDLRAAKSDCPAVETGPTAYKIIDLGAPRGAEVVLPLGVNGDNQVVGGVLMQDDTIHAFLWQNGRMQDLGNLGGTLAIATGINDRGQVAGLAETQYETIHGFLWAGGKLRDLSPQPEAFTEATGINDRGQVIGWSYNDAADSIRATLWQDFKPKDLGALPGDTDSIGAAINNKGEAVGDSTNDYELWRPFAYRGSGLEAVPMPAKSGFVTGCNDAGQVVGVFENGDNVRAFLTMNGRSQVLPTLGGQDSIVYGIGNNGVAVGWATTSRDDLRACVWHNGKAIDLNTQLPANSGWQLFIAFGVGKKGQFVGLGVHDRQLRAFLMTQ